MVVACLTFDYKTVLQSGCAILHFHQQHMSVTVSPHPSLSDNILTILVHAKWYRIVVLIFNTSMTNDVEHLFMCLLAICMSSLVKYLFKSVVYFFLNKLFILYTQIIWHISVTKLQYLILFCSVRNINMTFCAQFSIKFQQILIGLRKWKHSFWDGRCNRRYT